jgi:hypothetical protein
MAESRQEVTRKKDVDVGKTNLHLERKQFRRRAACHKT